MTTVTTQDLREKTMAFECLPIGSWFLFDEYAYIKVKPFSLKENEEIYNTIGTDGVAYFFEDQNVEPIDYISIIIEK